MDIGLIGTGLCMSIAAIGSCIGVVIAGTTCIGAWKKCYMSNKAAPFILTSFAGAPLTQTIYGFLLMQTMQGSSCGSDAEAFPGYRGRRGDRLLRCDPGKGRRGRRGRHG